MFGSSFPKFVCRMAQILLVFFVGLGIVMSNMLFYQMSLRSVFRVVMSATISACKRCSIRLYIQLFVGGAMSLFYVISGVQHILCF